MGGSTSIALFIVVVLLWVVLDRPAFDDEDDEDDDEEETPSDDIARTEHPPDVEQTIERSIHPTVATSDRRRRSKDAIIFFLGLSSGLSESGLAVAD